METGQSLISHEKRLSKAGDCVIQFVESTITSAQYNVIDEDGAIKYIGRIDKTPSLDEYCSCPDQFHRNTKFYKDEHGFSLQCKHIIQAKKLRGWANE